MLKEKLIQIAHDLCDSEGYELVLLEYIPGKKENMVRLFMDKENGITMDDCVNISRQLGDLIEVHIPDMDRYRLEVSSPGPRRPLTRKADFHRFKGERVKIQTRSMIEGRRKFTGVLEEINDDSVGIAVDGKMVRIMDQLIEKATLTGQ